VSGCYSTNNAQDGFSSDATPASTDQDNINYNDNEAYLNGRYGFFAHSVGINGSLGVWYRRCKSTYSGQTIGAHGFSAYFANNINYYECEGAYTNINPATGLPNAFAGSEAIGIAFDDQSGNGSCFGCLLHHNAN